jgi:hypothetical protein
MPEAIHLKPDDILSKRWLNAAGLARPDPAGGDRRVHRHERENRPLGHTTPSRLR